MMTSTNNCVLFSFLFTLALVPKTEKLSTLMAKGIVKKHELSKGQRTMGEFSKTSAAKAKERQAQESLRTSVTTETSKENEVDADEDVVMKL
jgi:hypothetical protein